MAMVTAAQTSAVPRSGSFRMRPMKTSGGSAARRMVPFQSSMAWMRVCRKYARKSTSTGFASSDGWKVKKPAQPEPAMRMIQRGHHENAHQKQVVSATAQPTKG